MSAGLPRNDAMPDHTVNRESHFSRGYVRVGGGISFSTNHKAPSHSLVLEQDILDIPIDLTALVFSRPYDGGSRAKTAVREPRQYMFRRAVSTCLRHFQQHTSCRSISMAASSPAFKRAHTYDTGSTTMNRR